MTDFEKHSPGVPCWVDVLSPDVDRVRTFYAEVLGWTYTDPGPMPDGGSYYVAMLDGKSVAGIGSLTQTEAPSVWTTYVRVDDRDAAVARARVAGGTVIASFDADPAGKGAVVSDSVGAVIGVWEPRDREGVDVANVPGAWAMSVLQTSDAQRAQGFYHDVFGWNSESFDFGGRSIELQRLAGYVGGVEGQPVPRDVVACIAGSDDATRNAWGVDFWSADVRRAAEIAIEQGGSRIAPPFDDGMFTRAVVSDPFGAIFTLSQLKR